MSCFLMIVFGNPVNIVFCLGSIVNKTNHLCFESILNYYYGQFIVVF